MELKDKSALVLGAVKGIGKEIAMALAREGVKTAINYFDWPEALVQTQRELTETGAEHLILNTDLLDTDAELRERVVARYQSFRRNLRTVYVRPIRK